MTKVSAGLLVYRRTTAGADFLLVHPGGPFWRNRDQGAWSIPKGLLDPDEDGLEGARREFAEEVGQAVDGAFHPLEPLRQKGGKVVRCWMVEANVDLARFKSNLFEMEWPRGSGRMMQFPECDRAAHFPFDLAVGQILAGQRGFLLQAAQCLDLTCPPS
jgi:predicted NUDIX family NTP pyrophosphohydrolase